MAGRDFLRNALKDFVFSLAQGSKAASETPGVRGGLASLGASIAAPQLRRDMELKQQQDQQERTMRMQALRQAIQTGDLSNVKSLIENYGKTEGPQTNVPRPTMTQAPIGDTLATPQNPEPTSMNMGPRGPDMGTQNISLGSPPPIQSGGRTFQPQFANQIRAQEQQQEAAKSNLGVQSRLSEIAAQGQQNRLTQAPREQRLNQTNANNLAKAGFRLKSDLITGEPTGEIEPLPEDQLSAEQKAKLESLKNVDELRKSQKELADATTELRKFQSDPNSPQYKNAAERLAISRQNADAAMARLGIAQENTNIRQATLEATGGISPDRQKMQANAQSGLRAIEKLKSELKKPGMLAQLAIPTSPGARTARAARNEMIDVLTRLRTGAALNKDEQAFYRDQAPGLLDTLFSGDADTIAYKLSIFEDEFKALAGPNAVNVPKSGGAGASSIDDAILKAKGKK